MTEQEYIRGKNCLRDLYNSKNKKNYDVIDKDRYETISEVKKLVRKAFSNIKTIEDNTNRKIGQKLTKEFLKDGYKVGNAILAKDDLSCKIDVLEKNSKGLIAYIIDVSGRTSARSMIKGEFIKYICNVMDEELYKIVVIHINTKYVRGNDLNLKELFLGVDITKDVNDDIQEEVKNIKKVLDENKKIKCEIDIRCIKSPKCVGIKECFGNILENSIFQIDGYSIKNAKKLEYYRAGIKTIEEVSENINPSQSLKIMLNATLNDQDYINKKAIINFLNTMERYPIYFLDFETFQEPIPSYKGRNPYMQIPFQYSLHILLEDGTLMHKEFLANENTDTTREVAEALIKDIKDDGGIIVAYNMTFEKSVIKNMGKIHKELSISLKKLNERFVDIMIPFKNKDYYKKEMEFSYSIKKVLPALCGKEVSYDKLNIKNGEMAMNTFPNLYKKDKEERENLRKDLLEYCKLDTLAMVKIYEKLKELVEYKN